MKELSDLIYYYSVKIAELESRLPKMSQAELDQVIYEEFQLSSEELKMIHQEFEHSLEAGYNFLREDNYERALHYFTDAIRLQPLNVSVLKGLAAANLALFVETGEVPYRSRLRENCEKMIAINPANSDAAKAITSIEKFEKSEKQLMVKGSIVGVGIFFTILLAIFSDWGIYLLAPIFLGGYVAVNLLKEYKGLRHRIFKGQEDRISI